MLPALNADGLLPPGIHPASLAEVRDRFVDQAPHKDRRERIWRALEIYLDELRTKVPRARLWLDGGFITHKDWEPADLDIAVVADDENFDSYGDADWEALWQLFTLQGVDAQAPQPMFLKRVQPMAGLMDTHLVLASDVAGTTFFRGWWAKVTDQEKKLVPGVEKGFVEVALS